MPEFDPLAFHEAAVRTPSHEDVTEMRALLRETLREHGHPPEVDDAGNVLASRGTGRPHVALNTHLDTVPPHVPFSRDRGEGEDDDLVRGRGACDAKGPLAALLGAFLAVEPGDGRVTLAVTPDEETESTGALALDGALAPDAWVVGEPTDLAACTSARGRFQATIRLSGVGAHAAAPESGVNAVAAAEHALAAVRSFDAERGPDDHPELGPATLTPTRIRGGDAANRVPEGCEVVVDRRTVPPETAEGFFRALREHVRDAVPESVGVAVEPATRATPFLEAWATPADAAVVEALVGAGAGDPRPFGAATEASYFAASAPTVVFGPGVLADDDGPVAHAEREYVRRADVERAAAVLTDALRALV